MMLACYNRLVCPRVQFCAAFDIPLGAWSFSLGFRPNEEKTSSSVKAKVSERDLLAFWEKVMARSHVEHVDM